jgi:hypothetical protein
MFVDGIKIAVDIIVTVVANLDSYLVDISEDLFRLMKLEDFVTDVASDDARFVDYLILSTLLESGVLDGKAYNGVVNPVWAKEGEIDDMSFEPSLDQLLTMTSSYASASMRLPRQDDMSFHMPGVPVFPSGKFMDYLNLVSNDNVNVLVYYNIVANPMSIAAVANMDDDFFPELYGRYTKVISHNRNGYKFKGADGGQLARIDYNLMAFILTTCTIPNVQTTFKSKNAKLRPPIIRRIELGVAKYVIETIAKVHLKCDPHIGDRPVRSAWTSEDLDIYPRINGGKIAPGIVNQEVISLINQNGRVVSVLANKSPDWVSSRYSCGSYYKAKTDGLTMFQLSKLGYGDIQLREMFPQLCRMDLFFQRKSLCDWWLHDDYVTLQAIRLIPFQSKVYAEAVKMMCTGIQSMMEEVHGWIIATRRFNAIRSQIENISLSIRDNDLDSRVEDEYVVCIEQDGTVTKSRGFRDYKTKRDPGLASTPISNRVGVAYAKSIADTPPIRIKAPKKIRRNKLR